MKIDRSNGGMAVTAWLLWGGYAAMALTVWLALSTQVEADQRTPTLQSGDDLIWTIQTGRELLDGQSQIQCHVDNEGMIDLGRYGRVKVAGLTISEAKAALENHVAGRSEACNQATERFSDLPAPVVAAAFMPAAPSPRIAPAPALADGEPTGIDRMISEHLKNAPRSPPRSYGEAGTHRGPEMATTERKFGRRTENSAATVSAALHSTAAQPIIQAATSPYHPLGAVPVCRASYTGPDPFPSDPASLPPDSGPPNAKPQSQSRPVPSESLPSRAWHGLRERIKSIRSSKSPAADGS